MDYYHLKSIVAAGKSPASLKDPLPSFQVFQPDSEPYIEPRFEKIVFEVEKPTVVLVSALGASGKTILARHLSAETGLPVLDLGQHRPVGDNTLTGLITSSFRLEDVSQVLVGLSKGGYGVIIDGVDEGRSKTKERAFEAFLDDIVRLTSNSPSTVVVMLGRTQALEDTWEYLSGKTVTTGVIGMRPFDLAGARAYIDAFTQGDESSHSKQYTRARDFIVSALKAAFVSEEVSEDSFLSFIGYPPVLDAIVTLLDQERNYHGLLQRLEVEGGENQEVELLLKISRHIMRRDRLEKVLPNFAGRIIAKAPASQQGSARSEVYGEWEQATRLIGHCLGKQVELQLIGDSTLDAEYEEALANWLQDHPFLAGSKFRNAVFEAVCLARALSSNHPISRELASEYFTRHKSSYHLVYMLEVLLGDNEISTGHLGALLLAATEFRTPRTQVDIRVIGPDEGELPAGETHFDLDVAVSLAPGGREDHAREFEFRARSSREDTLVIGPLLVSLTAAVPNQVTITGSEELEFSGPLQIEAPRIELRASSLVLHGQVGQGPSEVVLLAEQLVSSLQEIVTNGNSLDFVVSETSSLAYPVIGFASAGGSRPSSTDTRKKYIRLRRILLEFRSHSKGSLAKYRYKIEHERVLRNEMGRAILDRLLKDEVLQLKGVFYHLLPDGLHRHLGVSWHDLRRGLIPEGVVQYLERIHA